MASKIILVTGANQGIGYEVVKQLGKQGHTVYLGARDEKRGKEAEAKLHSEGVTTVKFIHLDVTIQSSVDSALSLFSSLHDHLDVLVNNAGIYIEGKGNHPTNVNIDLIKETYEVNLYGVIRVTNAFLPIVKKSSSPVILNVSSGLGSLTMLSTPTNPYHSIQVPGYNTSKSALNMYTVGLAAVLPEVKVNVIDPGYTATNLNNFSGPLKVEDSAAGIIKYGILIGKDGPHSKFLAYDGQVHPW